MPMPSSGAISLNDANIELGIASGTTISLDQAGVRTLFGVASGAIGMSNGYGKSNRVSRSITISSDTANYVLNTAKVTGYSAGKTDLTLTINSGVFVYSNSTGSYAFDVDTSWTAGDTITIVNNGVIVGRGGNGNSGAGGPGFRAQRAVSFNNANRIAGGGGGGGKGGQSNYSGIYKGYAYGGGGGGGIGNGPGGPGGESAGNTGTGGGSGTLTSPGGGGGGGFVYQGGKAYSYAGGGGTGGTYGSSGANGGAGAGGAGAGGGAAGGAVVGNANITWIATGTRNGSIS